MNPESSGAAASAAARPTANPTSEAEPLPNNHVQNIPRSCAQDHAGLDLASPLRDGKSDQAIGAYGCQQQARQAHAVGETSRQTMGGKLTIYPARRSLASWSSGATKSPID